jgi:hypothetical protein
MPDVLLDDVPVGAIFAECCAELRLIFNGSGMTESCHFQAKGLAATACAEL